MRQLFCLIVLLSALLTVNGQAVRTFMPIQLSLPRFVIQQQIKTNSVYNPVDGTLNPVYTTNKWLEFKARGGFPLPTGLTNANFTFTDTYQYITNDYDNHHSLLNGTWTYVPHDFGLQGYGDYSAVYFNSLVATNDANGGSLKYSHYRKFEVGKMNIMMNYKHDLAQLQTAIRTESQTGTEVKDYIYPSFQLVNADYDRCIPMALGSGEADITVNIPIGDLQKYRTSYLAAYWFLEMDDYTSLLEW